MVSILSIIAMSLSWVPPCRFMEVSLAPGFYLTMKQPHIKTSFSVFFPSIHSLTWSFTFSCPPPKVYSGDLSSTLKLEPQIACHTWANWRKRLLSAKTLKRVWWFLWRFLSLFLKSKWWKEIPSFNKVWDAKTWNIKQRPLSQAVL